MWKEDYKDNLHTKTDPEQKEIMNTSKCMHAYNGLESAFYHSQNNTDTCRTQSSETFKLEFMLGLSELNWSIHRQLCEHNAVDLFWNSAVDFWMPC